MSIQLQKEKQNFSITLAQMNKSFAGLITDISSIT